MILQSFFLLQTLELVNETHEQLKKVFRETFSPILRPLMSGCMAFIKDETFTSRKNATTGRLRSARLFQSALVAKVEKVMADGS